MKISRNDIITALEEIGLRKNDAVMLHSSLSSYGFYKDESGKFKLIVEPQILYECLRCVIGEGGTIIVPTFTYSWTRGEVFSYEDSASVVGQFSEYVRRLPGSIRSLHPILSVTANGLLAKQIVKGVDKTSFGENSPYDRIHQLNVKQVMFGVNVCSFKDYIEWSCNVPFRYSKFFRGWMEVKGNKYIDEFEHCVRYLNQGLDTVPFYDALREDDRKQIHSVNLGRSYIRMIPSKEMFELVSLKLKENPYFFSTKPTDQDAIHLIHRVSSSNGGPNINLSFVAVNENNIEKWIWKISNGIILKTLKIQTVDERLVLNFPDDKLDVFLYGFSEGLVQEIMEGEKLKEHLVLSTEPITLEMLKEKRWLIIASAEQIKLIDNNDKYYVNLSISLDLLDKVIENYQCVFILPVEPLEGSGADIAVRMAKNVIQGKQESVDVKMQMLLSIFKNQPLIAILSRTMNSLEELSIIRPDVSPAKDTKR